MATILVLEDDPSFADLVTLHLEMAGYVVRVANDPAEGLRNIIATPPDLVLLDLDLPYLSGFEVLEAIRSEAAYSRIPVVVVSGRKDPESYARCQKLGMNGYLTKPIGSDELLQAVGATLEAKSAQ